jgi:hypothetical protein
MIPKKNALLLASIALLLIIILGTIVIMAQPAQEADRKTPCYVGVAFGGNTTAEAKAIIDRTKNYTNLFILQSGPISTNRTATTEVCDYATQAGLNLIVYFGDLSPRVLERKGLTWRTEWVNNARSMYGERFLGVYYYDEPGGIYLDSNKSSPGWLMPRNATYDSIAALFERGFVRDQGAIALKNASIPIFCSDYALYWFDYLAGYDVVLAQVGWNQTLAKDIALVRGAATFQNKDWGAIITWKCTQSPYLDNGDNIYDQMRLSYQAGAKYITIFNYPYINETYGTMIDEHFLALEKFWDEVTEGRITRNQPPTAVLILPKNYGFGMRSATDTIWGYWQPDNNTPVIWREFQTLINRSGYSFDVAYDDNAYPIPSTYKTIRYWNSSIG